MPVPQTNIQQSHVYTEKPKALGQKEPEPGVNQPIISLGNSSDQVDSAKTEPKSKSGIKAELEKSYAKYVLDDETTKLLDEIIEGLLKNIKDGFQATHEEYIEIKTRFDKILKNNYNKNTQKFDTQKLIKDSLAVRAGLEPGEEGNNKKDIKAVLSQILSTKGKKFDFEKVDRKEAGESLAEYFKAKYEANPEDAIKELGILIINSSDEEKKLLMPVITNVFNNDAKAVRLIFDSFKAKENSEFLADNIDKKVLTQIKNKQVKSAIVHNMSYDTKFKLALMNDKAFQEFYESNYTNIDIILTLRAKGELIPDDLQDIAEQLDNYLDTKTVISASASQKGEEDIVRANESSLKDKPELYTEYCSRLIEFISNPANGFSEDFGKIKDLLDKVSEGEFSKVLASIPEKSAIDSETNLFKRTATPDEIAAKQTFIKEYNQQYVIDTTKAEQNVEPEFQIIKSENAESSQENGLSPVLFTGFKTLRNIFTGKVEVSQYEENSAIKGYKLLDKTEQGNILKSTIGGYLRKLIDNTKTATLKDLLAIGWKGKDFYSTKEVKETVEERSEKV